MSYARIVPLNHPVKSAIDWNHKFRRLNQTPTSVTRRSFRARKDEFLKTWTRRFRSLRIPNLNSYVLHHIEWAAFECWELQRTGRVAAATAPYWVGHVEELWLTSMDDNNPGILERAPTAASVTLPFLMQGGGILADLPEREISGRPLQADRHQDAHRSQQKAARPIRARHSFR